MVQIESLVIEEVELATEPFTAWFRIRVSIAGSAIARTVMKRYSDIVELLDELPSLLHLPNLPRQVDEHVLAQDPLYRKVVQAQFNGLLTKPDLISEPLVLDFFQANDDYAPRRPSVTSEFHKPDTALFNNALQAVSPKAGRESPLRRQSPMVSRSQANLLGIQPEPASDVAARRHWFQPMQRSMTLQHESTNTLERDSLDTPTRGVPRQKSMPNTWPQVTSDAASSTAAAPGSSNLLWEMPVSSNQSSFGLLAGLGNEGVRSMPDAQLASASVTVSQSSIGSLGSNSQSDAASAVSTPTKLCWDLPQNAATATPRRQYLLSTQSPFRQYLLPTREAPPGRQQDPIAEEAPSTVDVARRVHIQEEAHDDSTSHANLSTASSSVPEEASVRAEGSSPASVRAEGSSPASVRVEGSSPASPVPRAWSPSRVPPDGNANADGIASGEGDERPSTPVSPSSQETDSPQRSGRSGAYTSRGDRDEYVPKKSTEASSGAKTSRGETREKKRAPVSAKCVICFEKREEVAVDPCGHLSMCKECSEMVQQCPVCRAPIEKRLRVFIVR